MTSYALIALLLVAALPATAAVWPGREWPTATPESRGMSRAALDAAADYAQRAGGGSGCIIRGGYLVREWGSPTARADIKSATKGTFGTTALGLAVADGLVGLDDLAQKHYPNFGTEKPENAATGWLGRIRVRNMATMTAGFDDGRPPLLVYQPGTRGIYSNDTSNMLAELLTLRFHEDLQSVIKRRVMDPIGVAPEDWAWRANSYRAKTVGGLASREFASGITITHGALARIGYLYLHGGEWDGKQILPRDYVRTATQPTELPAPYSYYAFYWGSNAKRTYPELPADAFWALGLGDSFVVVCPSLDVVAVRLGNGSRGTALPGGEKDDFGERVAGFFRLVVQSVKAPYPPSTLFRGIDWAPADSIVRRAKGSDNWPVTWGDDDRLYTAYGDGNGFEPFTPKKLSLGLARVEGTPPDVKGANILSSTGETLGDGPKGKKASGILMVDGVLYLWARNAGNSQLAWSADHGATWTWADWKLSTSFGCPTFLNFGRDYAGARDAYVYVYSFDSDSAYVPADRMVMARVPKERIRERAAYEFFQGLDAQGRPLWTADVAGRAAVFTHKGRCYRSGITYDAGVKRYLWCQIMPGGDPAFRGDKVDTRFRGGFGIYEAPEPWGPWATLYFTEEWDMGPGESASLPTKWMSPDGLGIHLASSSEDSFTVRRGAILPDAQRKE